MASYESVFLDRDEKLMAVMGKANAEAILSDQKSKEGLVILSNKRIYFRGILRYRGMGGFPWRKIDAAVSLSSVQSCRKAYRTNTWAKPLGKTFLALGLICMALGMICAMIDLEEMLGLLATAFCSEFVFFMAWSIFGSLHQAGTYSMYLIENHERDYGINLSSVTDEEIEAFEKALKELTGKAPSSNQKATTSVAPAAAAAATTPTPVATAPAVDVPAELKKYKELLDAGIITQEEFDAKKAKLLDL